MRRHVIAERFFLVRRAFLFAPFFNVGESLRRRRRFRRQLFHTKETQLSAFTVERRLLPALERLVDREHKLRAFCSEAVERPAFDERFDRRTADQARVDAIVEVEKVLEGPSFFARAFDLRDRVVSARFDRREPEINLTVLDLVFRSAGIDARRNDSDSHAFAVVDMFDGLVAFGEVASGNVPAKERRHEFGGVVRF